MSQIPKDKAATDPLLEREKRFPSPKRTALPNKFRYRWTLKNHQNKKINIQASNKKYHIKKIWEIEIGRNAIGTPSLTSHRHRGERTTPADPRPLFPQYTVTASQRPPCALHLQ